MTGILELSYDMARDQVTAARICEYDQGQDRWRWNPWISEDKYRKAGWFPEALQGMEQCLRDLADASPLMGAEPLHPAYYKGGERP